MKLSKKKLISILKQDIESLGFTYFRDSSPHDQGTFFMKVEGDMFLALSLVIHRFYDSMFTASYYLSPTTYVGATWGDIPKDSYQRPGYILTENEFLQFSKDGNLIARDIWFDGFIESDVNDFIQIVKLTYKRFASNLDLRERIEQSKDVKLLVNLSRKTLEFAIRREFDEVLEYQPEKEIDGVPLDWFMASETVLRKECYILNKNTVRQFAVGAYRQFCLNKINDKPIHGL